MLIRMSVLAALLVGSVFLFSRAVEAQDEGLRVVIAPSLETFRVDPVHSSMVFRIKHNRVAYFYGRFNDISGSIEWDENHPTTGSLDIQIATESVDTANSRRDGHLRSDDFFSAEEHPTIHFRSKKIERDGEKFKMTGELTLRGVTKPVAVDLEYTGSATTGRGARLMGLHATFTIKRTDFEMPYGVESGSLSDDVTLMIGIEGVRRE